MSGRLRPQDGKKIFCLEMFLEKKGRLCDVPTVSESIEEKGRRKRERESYEFRGLLKCELDFLIFEIGSLFIIIINHRY